MSYFSLHSLHAVSRGSAPSVQPESLLQAVLFEEGFTDTAAQCLIFSLYELDD